MKKLISYGEYNTSFSKAFVVENNQIIKIGEQVEINGEVFTVRRIMFSSQPTDKMLLE